MDGCPTTKQRRIEASFGNNPATPQRRDATIARRSKRIFTTQRRSNASRMQRCSQVTDHINAATRQRSNASTATETTTTQRRGNAATIQRWHSVPQRINAATWTARSSTRHPAPEGLLNNQKANNQAYSTKMISRFFKKKSYGLLKLSFMCSESFTISYTNSYLVNFVHHFLKISRILFGAFHYLCFKSSLTFLRSLSPFFCRYA